MFQNKALYTLPVLAATAVLGVAATAVAASGYRYHGTEIGLIGEPYAVNERGDVVGTAQLNGPTFHAFLWRQGVTTDLGVLESGSLEYSRAMDVNDRGQVAGFGVVNQDPEQSASAAFLWQRGVIMNLGTIGTDSLAFAINSRGQVVGTSYTNSGQPHVILWQDGVLTDLGPGQGVDINDRGQVLGTFARANGHEVPGIWYRGHVTELATPPPYEAVRPIAINEQGWVVASALLNIETRGLLLASGSAVDLGTLGGTNTTVTDINSRGQVLGNSEVGPVGYSHPFLWERGRMVDLTAHGIEPEVTLTGLNDRSQLLGSRTNGSILLYEKARPAN
jgi:probable HAF family extracellular repeat protein